MAESGDSGDGGDAGAADVAAKLGTIRDSAALLRDLFVLSPVPYAVFRADGHCLITNPAYRAMFGREPPPEYDIFKDEVVAALGIADDLRRAFAGETVHTPTFWYDPRDLQHADGSGGRRAAIACTLFPLRDAAGAVAQVAIAYQDVTQELTAKAAAERERDLLRAIVDHSGDGIVVCDAEGTVREFNPEACRQHGVTKQEVGPPDWSRAYGLRRLDGVPLPIDETPLYQAIRGRRVENGRWLVARPDGELRLLVGTATPLRLADGTPAGGVLITRDETDRQRAEERHRFVAEASAALASSLDEEETLRAVGRLAVPSLADWCFVDMAEEDGRVRRVEVAHALPEDQPLAERARPFAVVQLERPTHAPSRALVSGRAVLIPRFGEAERRELATSDQHLAVLREIDPHSLMSIPLTARGRTLGVLTLATSRSRRRYGPSDLATAEDLSRRVALAADNARLYREARAAVRQRDEFLSIASHELRTPLTPLMLQIDTLTRRVADVARDEEARQWLASRVERLRRHGERMGRLIDELLDASRLGSGDPHLERESVDLAAVVREVAPGLVGIEGPSELHIDAPRPVVGRWDRLRVQQIVTNLLSNALKYGNGQPVEVAVLQENRDDPRATLVVTDHGIGIAPEAQQRIFERFERAVAPGHYGGLGLGLYVVRKLVEAMGGSVTVESVPGRGSTFAVQLPLGAAVGPPS